jgi:hypothetical protein
MPVGYSEDEWMARRFTKGCGSGIANQANMKLLYIAGRGGTAFLSLNRQPCNEDR